LRVIDIGILFQNGV